MKRYRWNEPNHVFNRFAVTHEHHARLLDLLDTERPGHLTQEKLSSLVEEAKLAARGPMTEAAYKLWKEMF